MIVLLDPLPLIVTEAVTSRSPLRAASSFVPFGCVPSIPVLAMLSVIGTPLVPAPKLIIEPGLALALMTASRNVQSADAGVIHVAPTPRGAMSSLRLTVKVPAEGDIGALLVCWSSPVGRGSFTSGVPGSGSGFLPDRYGFSFWLPATDFPDARNRDRPVESFALLA